MKDSEVKIVIIQFSALWNQKKENYAKIASFLKDIEADIIVLPELCTTGYSFLTAEEVLEVAETAKEVATFFQEFANNKQAVIIAGFAENDNGQLYNSAIIVSPFQDFDVYRKTHLFYKENDCFSDGNSGFKVIEHPIKDCKIGVMICYDWRFPESARTLALRGSDIIVCPANLPTTPWQIGMPCRALENQVFIAVANRCQTETRILKNNEKQELTFTGKSGLYDVFGTKLVEADAENDTVLTYTIDTKIARDKKLNEFNDLFNDRKPIYYS